MIRSLLRSRPTRFPLATPLRFADVDDTMDRAIARIVGGSAPASEILDEVHVQIEAALNRP